MLPPGDSSQPPPPPPPAERAVNLLGWLPTELRDKVLAGLPARDVVRTSAVSRALRDCWKSIPGLDIELHDVRDDAGTWASVAGFLENCARPVGRVSIRGVPLRVCHRADDWVRAVAETSPRSLSIELPFAAPLPSLFSSDPNALAELQLRRCIIPAPPAGFAGFKRLTRLDLDSVIFTDASAWAQLKAPVSAAAPTLVELRLQDIAFFPVSGDLLVPAGEWVIKASNLRRLVLCLRIPGVGLRKLGPLPNLELARIFLDEDADDTDYVHMFPAISNVRELHLGNFDMATQAGAINIFLNLLWKFQNLRILRLDGNLKECPTEHILRLCPSLETIDTKRWY